MGGVPVYGLSNGAGEFVLVAGVKTGRRLGLFCFREEDAAALLEQVVKDIDDGLRQGSTVVPVALNKVKSFHVKISFVFCLGVVNGDMRCRQWLIT